MREHKLLIAIIILFVFLGLAGVRYGLPLWLVEDEPPYILAALKMIQLRTFLPVLHMSDFQPFLYYPPYLSFLFLPFFLLLTLWKLWIFNSDISLFPLYIAANTSVFFVIARVVILLGGSFAVWGVYKASQNIFKDKMAALASSFFLATSVTFLALSMTSRQWAPLAIILVAAFYCLTVKDWSFRKRYFFAILILSVGMGVNVVAALGLFLAVFWYIFYEKRSFFAALKDYFSYVLLLVFLGLALLPNLIYPASLGFKGGTTLLQSKSLADFLWSPFKFIVYLARMELVLILFSTIGAVVAFRKKKKYILPIILFLAFYGFVFFLFFDQERYRFVLPLVPFLALIAGYGFSFLQGSFGNKYLKIILYVFLALPVLTSLQLAVLVWRDDSRIQARDWVERNIPVGAKVAVLAPQMRISANKSSEEELKKINPNSWRKIDEAESRFDGNPFYPSFHALNLYTVYDSVFFKNLESYLYENEYEYIVISSDFKRAMPNLNMSDLSLKASFGTDTGKYSFTQSRFEGFFWDFWSLANLGPEIFIYEIKDK